LTVSGDRLEIVIAVRSEGAVWRRVARYRELAVLLAAGAIAAVGFTHLIDFGIYHLRYGILNANSAASWSHVVVAGALALGAAVCLAGARRSPRQRAAWIATAVILAVLFVGDVSPLHAEIDALNHGRLLYAPILSVLAYCVWRLTRSSAYFAIVRAGAALLLASYVIHVLEPHSIARALGWRVGGWEFQVVVALKEGTELAGVLLALLAVWGTAAATSQLGLEAAG
jgi:hypothetical protein